MPNLTQFARCLRNNPTDAERLLWSRLKSRQVEGVKFRRQQPMGCFIVDFVSFEASLVVELDGSQHVTASSEDRERDGHFTGQGFKVLRFWNNEVFENLEGVLEMIRLECTSRGHPPPRPLPSREGE